MVGTGAYSGNCPTNKLQSSIGLPPSRVQECKQEVGGRGEDGKSSKFLDPFSEGFHNAGKEPDDSGVHPVTKVF